VEGLGRRLRWLGAAGALSLAAALLTPASAQAETARDADRAAAAALEKVVALQRQVDSVMAEYETAIDSVGVAVSRGVSAEQRSTELGLQAGQERAAAGARVRMLYRNGGPLAVYATVLSSGSIGEAVNRLGVAQHVVGRSAAAATETSAQHGLALSEADAARERALAEVRGTRSVKRSYAVLTALLDQQAALLEQARGRARTLHEAEQLQARLEAARKASEAAGLGLARRANPMAGSAAYFALYHAAARTCPGLSWSVLAAIGQVESGHGRNPGVSYAGAQGPMQFMPATFAHYAVDGDGDGVMDIQSAADAIFTAAHYLCANGAGKGPDKLYFAIYRYNHADWYVQLVLTLAAKYAARDGA
jgi:peptidoglycan hydrolase CwlO-like protein